MHEPPADLGDDQVRRCLQQGWGIDAEVAYAAVGFGSHHWVATSGTDRWFVTVDDLRHKPMLGDDPGTVAHLLSDMHRAARQLQDRGLEFVVAPVELAVRSAALPGLCTAVLDDRWSVTVLPYVAGTTWGYSHTLPAAQHHELIGLLARLHAAAPPDVALRTEIPPSGRDGLWALIEGHDAGWTGGPFSEQALGWLVEHRDLLRTRLAEVDAVAARIRTEEVVVTHGEPHPGNLVGAHGGLRLVDWDTVALAPRERDLWLVGTDEATVSAYEAAVGVTVDRRLLAAYRLAWDLADVASFLDELRAPHADTADTRDALAFLRRLELAPLTV